MGQKENNNGHIIVKEAKVFRWSEFKEWINEYKDRDPEWRLFIVNIPLERKFLGTCSSSLRYFADGIFSFIGS
jgi:hypothetical protein